MYNIQAIKYPESCPSWSKEHDWKSCKPPKRFRGFESHALRQKAYSFGSTLYFFRGIQGFTQGITIPPSKRILLAADENA